MRTEILCSTSSNQPNEKSNLFVVTEEKLLIPCYERVAWSELQNSSSLCRVSLWRYQSWSSTISSTFYLLIFFVILLSLLNHVLSSIYSTSLGRLYVFSMYMLTSICPVSDKFFKPSSPIRRPRIINLFFLVLSICILFP